MNALAASSIHPPLTLKEGLTYGLGAVVAFQLAYTVVALSFLIVVYLYCLLQLSRADTVGRAINIGWGVGILVFGPQLTFFLNIFGPSGVVLWLVLGFWVGLFLAVLGVSRRKWGERVAIVLTPVLWVGFEYLRSECYFLRFSWLNAGYAFTASSQLPVLAQAGVYGMGFVLMALAALVHALPRKTAGPVAAVMLAVLGVLANIPFNPAETARGPVKEIAVAGVQFEGYTEMQVVRALDELNRKHPAAELLVVSEYAFDGPLPEQVRTWCRDHKKYLIAGGTEPLAQGNYYNTAFVVDPRGEIVFKQVKAVPLPFFKDGLPAIEQRLWDSPWGKIGICICYDLSFVRVTDELIRQGAQALIVPTMDAIDWGAQQHEMHTRVAQMRAAEYGVPIFRVASSGVSQLVDRFGREIARASFPGELETITGKLMLAKPGTLARDRELAQLAALVAASIGAWFVFASAADQFSAIRFSKTSTLKHP